MEIRVLGPMDVISDGSEVGVGGPKQRLVLALLVAAEGYVVSVDSLIDRVWGDSPPGDARSSIHTYISRLRGVFGDRLERVGDGYRLNLDADQVDARRFGRLVAEAQGKLEADPEAAAEQLRAALAMWRGHPYADLRDEPALKPELTGLEELRTAAVEARIDADLALGHDADLVGELEVLTAEYPFHERFRYQHMLALYRAGRQAEALRAYQRTRTTLGEELGVEPSPELQDLEDRILRQDPTLELDVAPRVDTRAILLTDLESSTVLWELHPMTMPSALAKHDEILTAAVEDAGGRVFKATGDGVCAEFAELQAAVTAAAVAQRDLVRFEWGETGPLRARMAVDIGEVEARGGDLFGPTVNRCARIMSAGHGGQILLSNSAHRALIDSAEAGWEVRTLGEYRFKGLSRPHQVSQLIIEGLPAEFPPLQIDRLPPPLPGTAFGRTVRGYELREQIGGGDFGIVYRAYQPTVGREVAVKVIRPEYVDQPAFVRRFEAEAQLVAQLEHPHIVALYDYWRDPDGAYLVMRWLRGGSLRKALDRGPFNHATALTLLDQIGGALSYAHRQGIAHRDLKPGNVMLDDEGNAYLTDFGIAARLVDASDAGRPYATSPAYLPPEELRGDPITVRSDIYALGMLTFELLTGQPPPMDGPLPPAHEIRPDLPISLAGVIDRAVADDPADRFATVGELLAALHAGFGEEPAEAISAFTPTRNPYKGLNPFQEADSVDFHGRDSMVDQLLTALAEHPLVAVVGPSGIGKSSVVRAGLIPALRAGRLPGSRQWLVTDMYPGSYPFEELAGALLKVAATAPAELAEDLQRDARGLLRASKQLVGAEDTVLLVIDQFEELFTLTRDEGTRQLFLDALTTVLDDDRSRVKVVVTLRADFFDRPLRYPEFGELLKDGLVAVTALTVEELTAAIEAPAQGVGIKLEPGLTEHILADLHHQPGALPLLQYALTELFSSRHSDLLTIGGYDAAGGVTGALGRRAEQLYAGLGESGREMCRQLFLRLVNVEEQTERTRRRVRRTELQGLGSEDELEPVLKLFGEHRLLSFDRDPVTRGPTVEVAHEALLSDWERLDGWITEQRESLILHGRFRAAVEEWLAADRSDDFLLAGGRLAQFEAWAQGGDLTLTADERELLGGSLSRADRDQARRRRRRRTIMGGFAVVAVVAVVFAVFALIQQQRAEENADEAQRQQEIARENEQTANEKASEADENRLEAERQRRIAEDNAAIARVGELTAESAAVLQSDPELALLLAREAVMEAQTSAPGSLWGATTALHGALNANRLVASFGPEFNQHFAFDPTRERIFLFGGTVNAVSELRDGRWTEPEPLDWLPGPPQYYQGGTSEIQGVVHPNGETLLLMRQFWNRQQDSYISLSAWDIDTGTQLATTESEQRIWTTAGDGLVWLGMGSDWASPIPADSPPGVVEAVLESLPGITDVSVRGAGIEADPWVVGFEEHSRAVEHLELRVQQRMWLEDPDVTFSLIISFDVLDEPSWIDIRGDTAAEIEGYAADRGATVAGSGTEEDPWTFMPIDGTVPPVVYLRVESGVAPHLQPASAVLGGAAPVRGIWTDAGDGSVWLGMGSDRASPIPADSPPATVEEALESLPGITEVSVDGSGTKGDPWVVRFQQYSQSIDALDVRVGPGSEASVFGGGVPRVWEAVFNPDGSQLALTGFASDELQILDGHTLAIETMFPLEWDDGLYARGIRFSPDGRSLAVASFQTGSDQPLVWDLEKGEAEFVAAEPWAHNTDVAFLDDGRLISTGQFAPTIGWDLATGEAVFTAWKDSPGKSVDVAPEAGLFAVGLDNAEIQVFEDDEEYRDARLLFALRGHDSRVLLVQFSSTERYLASLEEAGGVMIWDVSPAGPGELLASTNIDQGGVAWSPDGTRVAATGRNGGLAIWDVEAGTMTELPPFGTRLDGEATIWGVPLGEDFPNWSSVGAVAFSPEGDRLAASLNAGGSQMLQGTAVLDLTSDAARLLSEHPAEEIVWSADGSRIAGSVNGEALVWDATTFAVVFRTPAEVTVAYPTALSPDGRRLATDVRDPSQFTPGSTAVWDIDQGTKLTEFGGCASPGGFRGSLQFLDADTLLCAGWDPLGAGSGVGLWDAVTGDQIQPLDYHDGQVWSAAASPDGRLIVTAGTDGTIALWDGESFERLSVIEAPFGESPFGIPWDLELSPDGRQRLATTMAGFGSGGLQVWALDADDLLAVADGRITRVFTEFECETYHIDPCPTGR